MTQHNHQLTPADKKYLRKRRQIAAIIESKRSIFNSREDIYNMWLEYPEAKEAAEEILAKMGISKPKHLSNY